VSEDPLALGALQGWMQEALVHPRSADQGDTERIVEASPRLSSAARLAIYQRSYYLRLLKCMDEQFPALRHALGEDLFTEFAREYLETMPSASYTLYNLGERFPRYLESNRPDRDQPHGERETWVNFMVDLAQCERDLFVMFEAPGHEGKPFADEQVPDDLLRLQPCFALHEYRFPVSWYYFEVKEGNAPELPPEERSCVALARQDYFIRTFPLYPAHYTFLTAVAEGKSIAEALEIVAGDSDRSLEEVTMGWSGPDGMRKRWLDAGFFIAAD